MNKIKSHNRRKIVAKPSKTKWLIPLALMAIAAIVLLKRSPSPRLIREAAAQALPHSAATNIGKTKAAAARQSQRQNQKQALRDMERAAPDNQRLAALQVQKRREFDAALPPEKQERIMALSQKASGASTKDEQIFYAKQLMAELKTPETIRAGKIWGGYMHDLGRDHEHHWQVSKPEARRKTESKDTPR